MRHGCGLTEVDTYISIPQRKVACLKCGSEYTGIKEEVQCKGCGAKLKTLDLHCKKKVPTGIWMIANRRVSKSKNEQ